MQAKALKLIPWLLFPAAMVAGMPTRRRCCALRSPGPR